MPLGLGAGTLHLALFITPEHVGCKMNGAILLRHREPAQFSVAPNTHVNGILFGSRRFALIFPQTPGEMQNSADPGRCRGRLEKEGNEDVIPIGLDPDAAGSPAEPTFFRFLNELLKFTGSHTSRFRRHRPAPWRSQRSITEDAWFHEGFFLPDAMVSLLDPSSSERGDISDIIRMIDRLKKPVVIQAAYLPRLPRVPRPAGASLPDCPVGRPRYRILPAVAQRLTTSAVARPGPGVRQCPILMSCGQVGRPRRCCSTAALTSRSHWLSVRPFGG